MASEFLSGIESSFEQVDFIQQTLPIFDELSAAVSSHPSGWTVKQIEALLGSYSDDWGSGFVEKLEPETLELGSTPINKSTTRLEGSECIAPVAGRRALSTNPDDTLETSPPRKRRASITDAADEENPNKKSKIHWSQTKTKRGHERKRVPQACVACRQKKIRCSGEPEACKSCQRTHDVCVYPTAVKAAPTRVTYMNRLAKRLKRMEDRILKLLPESERTPSTTNVTRAVLPPPNEGTDYEFITKQGGGCKDYSSDRYALIIGASDRQEVTSTELTGTQNHGEFPTDDSNHLRDTEYQQVSATNAAREVQSSQTYSSNSFADPWDQDYESWDCFEDWGMPVLEITDVSEDSTTPSALSTVEPTGWWSHDLVASLAEGFQTVPGGIY